MRTQLTVAFALAVAAAGCSSPTGLSNNTVETFTGTVQPSGSVVHNFNIGNTGEVAVTLTALAPGGNAVLGIGYGQPSGATCALATTATPVFSTTVGKMVFDYPIYSSGAYCVLVGDYALFAGTTPLTVAQTYTITVSHP